LQNQLGLMPITLNENVMACESACSILELQVTGRCFFQEDTLSESALVNGGIVIIQNGDDDVRIE